MASFLTFVVVALALHAVSVLLLLRVPVSVGVVVAVAVVVVVVVVMVPVVVVDLASSAEGRNHDRAARKGRQAGRKQSIAIDGADRQAGAGSGDRAAAILHLALARSPCLSFSSVPRPWGADIEKFKPRICPSTM